MCSVQVHLMNALPQYPVKNNQAAWHIQISAPYTVHTDEPLEKKGLLTKVTTLKRLFDIKHFSQKLSQIIWSFIPTYEKVFIQTSSQRWCCVYYLCRNVLMTKSHEKQTHGVGDQMAGSVGYCFTGKCTAEQIWPMSISFCSTL